jgi:hypothetical protein
MKKLYASAAIAGLAIVLLFSACKKTDPLIQTGEMNSIKSGKGSFNHESYMSAFFYALAGGIKLDKYNISSPNDMISSANISGLQTGETILAIDFRPATGQLYGLGSSSRLYVINPATGAARMIGTNSFNTPLTGDISAFDFNPTVDRIRVVTSSGQNLRLNPESGAVAAVDGSINGATGAIIGAVAYTNNFAGATSTILYDIDTTSNSLYIQTPPNNGTLSLVGSLDLNVGDGGFDISGSSALGLFKVDNASTLISVNLSTGKASVLAKYDQSLSYNGFAIPTAAVAYATDVANNLIIFNPGEAGNGFGGINTNNSIDTIMKKITGLPAGVSIVGIDFRPLNGQLYALGSNSGIYTLNTASGAAAAAGTLSTPLAGSSLGFDFNPVVDRIRIVSNTGQNLRFNPNDGTTLVDGSLNPGTPDVSAAAYANNFAGTAATTLFVIDGSLNKLYTVSPPNAGTLVFRADLEVNVGSSNGFDIGGTSGMAYTLFSSGNNSKLYNVNLTTGTVNKIGSFKSGDISGFTLGLGF